MREPKALSGLLRAAVDPAFEAIMDRVARKDVRGPLHARFAPHRKSAMQSALSLYAPEAKRLEAGVLKRNEGATRRYDAVVAEAIATMRAERPGEGERGPRARLESVLGTIEGWLYKDEPELMDDPSFPEDERTASLETLDRFNRRTGIYETVAKAIEPLLQTAERQGRRPVVHDVAAGHGGLAIYLAERLGARARIEASDLRGEYLALGEEQAKERGLDVSFSVEDALDLSGLGARGVDIILCTQALHHFPPGMIGRMLGEAARAARVGVCFIDGERSWLSLGLMALTGALYGRTYAFFHDSTTSIRRMFYEEELALIAALAPGMPPCRLETQPAPPSHFFVRAAREIS